MRSYLPILVAHLFRDCPHGRKKWSSSDPFNSPPHRLARLSFADRAAYRRATASLPGPEPYCAACDWEHAAANIDGAQIRQYLAAAGGGMFDDASVRMLADW